MPYNTAPYAVCLTALCYACIACGSGEEPTSTPSGGRGGGITDGGGGDRREGGDDAPADHFAQCESQRAELQAILDAQRTADLAHTPPNAVLAVRDPVCGTAVYVSGDPATADVDSLYRIASVTKTFVMASTLSLVREGSIGLDDAPSLYIPDVAQTAGVTLRMLLSHQSGIVDYLEIPEYWADITRAWQPRELVDLATAQAPYFAPGSGCRYSNTNYVLLGMILAAVEGRPAGDVLHARAIDVAGLSKTFLDGYEPLQGALASAVDVNGTDLAHLSDPSGPSTAYGMVASGRDLVDWIFTLFGTDTVLDAQERASIVATPTLCFPQPAFPPELANVRYGLGTNVIPPMAGAGVGHGHGGSLGGYETTAYYFPAVDTAIAIVINRSGDRPDAALQAVVSALFP